MLDPYEGKIKPTEYFCEGKQLPPATSSKFQNLVVSQNDREKIEESVFARRKVKMGLRTEEDVSERLAIELKEMQRKRLVEQKMRQQVRENNEELKELERKLRSAYVSKALAAQVAEREALRAAEKTQIRKENEVMENARRKLSEVMLQEEEDQLRKKIDFKEGLLEQINLTQQKKAKRYEDFLKEKEIVDEIIRKISEEQLEEMREKLSKKVDMQKEMAEFLRLQREWQEKQRRETEEEMRQIAEILKIQDNTAEEIRKEKQRKLKIKEDISEMIGQKIFSEKEEKRRKMELLEDLQVQEREAMAERKAREDMERELRERIITRIRLQEHRDDVMRRKQEEQEEDRKFKEEQMRIMAERDKLDQLSDEKKRRKLMEHRKAIQQSFDERRRRRAEELAISVKEREQDLQEEKWRQQLIEEERIRMLKEHAAELLGYWPRGILKESDREHLALPPKK